MLRFGLFFVIAVAGCNGNPLTTGGPTNDLGALPDGAGVSCSGLGETACATSPSCVADHCHFCGCEVAAFVRCRGVDETPKPCPTPSCPAGICCASNANCVLTKGSVCVPPGQPIPHCGSECSSDADCAGRGPNPKCLPPSCASACCGNFCAPGCNVGGDCADGEVCAGGLCGPPACRSSSPSCPGNFVCSGSICERASCTTDSDCGAPNRCVVGRCYLGLGNCAALSR